MAWSGSLGALRERKAAVQICEPSLDRCTVRGGTDVGFQTWLGQQDASLGVACSSVAHGAAGIIACRI